MTSKRLCFVPSAEVLNALGGMTLRRRSKLINQALSAVITTHELLSTDIFELADVQMPDLEERLLKLLSQGGKTQTQLYRALRNSFDAQEIGECLLQLERTGILSKSKAPRTGRTATVWSVRTAS